jgi:Domain of unknown function (DUF4287)
MGRNHRRNVMPQEIVMSSPNEPGAPSSSAAIRRTTGRDRAEWFAVLDAWGATGRPYREIADWLKTEHNLSNWWAQKLIVEYEEARGLREPGVRRDGSFEVGASKTVNAAPERVIHAFVNAAVRDRWLPGVDVGDMERTPDRIRFGWTDGASRVTVSVSSAAGKTLVVVQHDRLRDGSSAQRMKAFWRDRLTVLKALLET